MILLFTRFKDDTTVKIIEWLSFLKKPFYRIHSSADLQELQKIADSAGGFSKFTSFYFNGGSLAIPSLGIEDKDLDLRIREYLKGEADTALADFLSQINPQKEFGLSPYSEIKINKISTLRIAKNVGLEIPEFKIVTQKQELKDLKIKWGRIITKGLDAGMNIQSDRVIMNGQRTRELTEDIISKMDMTFFPTFVQELIEKKFEVRTFFFRGSFKSIAIFSQVNSSTSIDWRNSGTYEAREVPFQLPAKVEEQLSDLMGKLGLNYGSIDMICTKKSSYCFLEVNPYGQYGFLSRSGNYYLEKQIAEYL